MHDYNNKEINNLNLKRCIDFYTNLHYLIRNEQPITNLLSMYVCSPELSA